MHDNQKDLLLHHTCEVCGQEEIVSVEEGFNNGWNYPPRVGTFSVVSPRTCGNCAIDQTLWWEIVVKKAPKDKLTPKQIKTLERILKEPESIIVE